MIPEVFSYRDFVPAFVVTAEVRRLDDLLQSDYSRPAQMGEQDLSAAAQQVLAGLNRMVAIFKAEPVSRDILDLAKAGVRGDLTTSREHERSLEDYLHEVEKTRAQALMRRPARRQKTAQRNLLTRIDKLADEINRELEESRRVSAAYIAALSELDTIAPKVLTAEELILLASIDKRLATLTEVESNGRAIAREYSSEPLMAIHYESKSPRRRLDERSALALASALAVAIPAVFIAGAPTALVLGGMGMIAGAALYPLVENRF